MMAVHQQTKGILEGGVVGTEMSNLGMELALAERQIPFVRAKVGDRYVNELLLKYNWYPGGESSGHLICRKATTTGDGLVAAMHVLDAIITADKPLAELRRGMTKHPQHSINLEMKQRRDMDRIPAINRAIEECDAQLAGRGWVVLRPSGTFVVSPYAAYQYHKRLHPGSRRGFWVAYWLFFGVPFTLNAVHGSLWWRAFWPVSYIYILGFSMAQMAKD